MIDRPQTTLTWSDAAPAILARVAALQQRAQPHEPRCVMVGITGAVAAGKSTLARALSSTIVSTDHYLPDYDATPEAARDLPESSDLRRLARDLASLRAGQTTSIPQWSFESHSRVGALQVPSAPIVVCEGLHALHALPRELLDLRVFVDATQAARWKRCVAREQSGERGWSLAYLEHFFHTVAEVTYARFADEYRSAADFVILNEPSE